MLNWLPAWGWIATRAAAVLILAVLCHGTGRAVMSRIPCASAGLRAVVATGLGFGILGQLLFAVGSAGALTRPVVFALLLLMALPAARHLRELWATAARAPIAVLLLLGGGSLLPFLVALFPPTGFDATSYHLTYARLFADAGSLVYAGTLRFPVFPQHNELLFTAALLVADDVTAQLTQWLCLVVTAAAAGAMTRTLRDLPSALLAIAIWLAVPLARFLGSNAYIDCGLTMFVTLAFAAWLQWRSTDHPGWITLTGVFAGMAAATKYNGLVFIAFFGLAVLAVPSRRRFRNVALFILAVVVVAGPWYLRIAAWTGNPVFPYFTSIFGANDWNLRLDASLHFSVSAPTLKTWLTYNAYNLRPWILTLTPFAAAGALFDRRIRFLFLGALAATVVFWKYDSRFLIVIVPLLAICSAVAIGRLIEWMPRMARAPVTAMLIVVMLLPATLWDGKLLKGYGKPPRTAVERDAYLEARIRAYRALRHIARTAGPRRTVYAFHAENASYYWEGRYLGDHFGPYRYEPIWPLLQQHDRLADLLRSFGAEYLLVPRDFPLDPPASSRLEPFYSDDKTRVFRIRSRQ